MGLTHSSTGRGAVDIGLTIEKRNPSDLAVALAGNPNVGKSTLFNTLTGLHQHTGNWPGKTVTNAQGYVRAGDRGYHFVDIPGTYSLLAQSAEEETARNYLCFGSPDAVVVVCDATCLTRNLNLVLQAMEISKRCIVCLNMMEEARRKHITVLPKKLSEALGIPVIACNARKKKTLYPLLELLASDAGTPPPQPVDYGEEIERAISRVVPHLPATHGYQIPARWLALRLLSDDPSFQKELVERLGENYLSDPALLSALKSAKEGLNEGGIDEEALRDSLGEAVMRRAVEIADIAVEHPSEDAHKRDRAIDRILTGKVTAYPVMLLLLALVFWITIAGANYPSALLSRALFALEEPMTRLFTLWHFPLWLTQMLVTGVWRTLAWVVAVMLPPMAIFFPLFTLLEDAGFLPRIAFNLDRPFRACHACGKQALTMCMGFGCNAAGVVGCRIIDSPRERLLAILTNVFVPCNGRFPTLITILTLFFVGSLTGIFASLASALLLTAVIVLGVAMTFLVTRILSVTCLRGVPSGFTLELPPYRRPQVGQVLVRSVFDRTLFVLGRAAAVAAPAGLVIWLLGNLAPGGIPLIVRISDFLDPVGQVLGMDGVLLLAFFLAFPANEILIPVALMAYTAGPALSEYASNGELHALLLSAGWSRETALCLVLFSLFHFPCSTTLITTYRETKSVKWTALALLLPTAVGVLICLAVHLLFRLFC